MATTKLWHIKGRLRDLIEYVENPAKTVDPSMQDFFNVFSYAQKSAVTAQITELRKRRKMAISIQERPPTSIP